MNYLYKIRINKNERSKNKNLISKGVCIKIDWKRMETKNVETKDKM